MLETNNRAFALIGKLMSVRHVAITRYKKWYNIKCHLGTNTFSDRR